MADSSPHELFTNKKAWDHLAEKYFGACSLPAWGPFNVCADRDLLGSVTHKTVLEIGCGSGHSISYLTQLGVKKAYGLDISTTQIAFATELNREHIESGRVQLFEAPMEQRLGLRDIDIVLSIYTIGWTRNPKMLFENLWVYLRPGGKLVWSWEHPLFSKVRHEAGNFVVRDSYFDERARFAERWGGGEGVYMQTRTIASWFHYLTAAGFTVCDFLEPQPVSTAGEVGDPSRYYSSAKASTVPCTIVFVCEKT
jgi:SAM-dependent methyltransferase